jgi:subfamily B ATP-binding cassette protein MsbA
MKKDFHLYMRLLGHIKPYWKLVALSIFGMIVSAGLEPVLPALMKPLIDQTLIQREGSNLWQVPSLIVIAFMLKGLADYVANVAGQSVAQKTMADLREKIFSQQIDLPVSRHRTEPGGRMLSRITYDTSLVGDAVSTAWLTIIRDSLALIGLLGFMFYTAWQLALLVLLIGPALAFAIRRINERLRISSKRVQNWMGQLTGTIEEALLGLQEIKIYMSHRDQAERFGEASQGLRREQMRVIRVQAMNVPLVQVLAACSVASVIYLATTLNEKNILSPGDFVAFITAMSMVFEPIRRLTNVNSALQRGLAAAESIFSILDEPGEGQSRIEGSKSSLDSQESATSGILVKNIYHRYENQKGWALANFSAEFRMGAVTYVGGESGGGKSTLLNLIAGIERPCAGSITIDGVSAHDLSPSTLRSKVALVSQQTNLFNTSIRKNLLIGRPDASEEQLWEALTASNADRFVKELPHGLDTNLGSLGKSLSGGERQRLSIARAYLKNPPILLLDEPTSALDPDARKEFLGALKNLIKNRITIIVSHDESLIQIADSIIQIEKQS